VPPHRTCFVTNIAIQSRLAPLEVLDRGSNGLGRHGKLCCAATIGTQHAVDMECNGWSHIHFIRPSIPEARRFRKTVK
jgi:hypothetical protein